MPDEVLNLLIIAVLKCYAAKFNVRKISVDGTEGCLELPSINSLKDVRLTAALDKYKGLTTLSMAKVPQIVFAPLSSPTKTMLEMTKFLKFASTFTQD
jgi:transcription-repair coupling factor (superfamily II helicase)